MFRKIHRPATLSKNRIRLFVTFGKFFKNTFLTGHLRATASENTRINHSLKDTKATCMKCLVKYMKMQFKMKEMLDFNISSFLQIFSSYQTSFDNIIGKIKSMSKIFLIFPILPFSVILIR